MANQAQDEAFAKYVLQTGVVRLEHLDAARSEQSRSGLPVSEILVAMGAITPLQRQDIEKRVQSGLGETPPQLGNYRLLCKLGEGGMGTVYLCADALLDRQVAVKILPSDVTKNPELLSRFRREAIAAGKLNHANIATAYAVGEESGHHFYVMEYCRGEPLDKMLKRLKHLSEQQVVQLAIPVARGLQYAHQHGILHRDIKPANIMNSLDGTVKVLDLGLSKNVADNEQSFQTTSGLALGTPHYISPEQARGDKVVDGRTDVYSLGATMFHLATGRPPFIGTSAAVIMTKHLNDPVPDPRGLNSKLSDRFASVVLKAMSKKPADRYASMNDFAEDLERLASGQPVKANLRKAYASGVAGGDRPSGRHDALMRKSRSERDGAPRRIPPAVLWGATGFLAVAVGVAVFMLRSHSRPSVPPPPPKETPPVITEPVPKLPPPAESRPGVDALHKAYEQLLTDIKSGDLKSRMEKVQAFLGSCDDPILAARARLLLAKMKEESAAAVAVTWQPLFDGTSINCLVDGNRGNWTVDGGGLTNVPGTQDAAQSRRDFGDGRLRIRFTVRDASSLRFTLRQGAGGGYTVQWDKRQLPQLSKEEHELQFSFKGPAVTAALDGQAVDVRANGSPQRGRLQFSVSEGRLRILAIDFAPAVE